VEGPAGVYGVFVNHQGQRKAKKVDDTKAAEAVATAIRAELAKGTFKLPQATIAFDALAEEWLQTYPVTDSIGATTVENYTSVVRAHLIPHFQVCAVSSIDHAAVERFTVMKGRAGARPTRMIVRSETPRSRS
jgi:hypothetical protein